MASCAVRKLRIIQLVMQILFLKGNWEQSKIYIYYMRACSCTLINKDSSYIKYILISKHRHLGSSLIDNHI